MVQFTYAELISYCKFPKYLDTQKICCSYSEIWTMWLYHRVNSPNDADGMANSVDPDQTAPSRSSLIWVCTVCPCLSVRKLRIITVLDSNVSLAVYGPCHISLIPSQVKFAKWGKLKYSKKHLMTASRCKSSPPELITTFYCTNEGLSELLFKIFEPGHEKTCLMSYANNKGADQPAHPRSLISPFVVHCLDSVMSLVSVTKISSLMLTSTAEQASLSLTGSETPEDMFSHDEAHLLSFLNLNC